MALWLPRGYQCCIIWVANWRRHHKGTHSALLTQFTGKFPSSRALVWITIIIQLSECVYKWVHIFWLMKYYYAICKSRKHNTGLLFKWYTLYIDAWYQNRIFFYQSVLSIILISVIIFVEYMIQLHRSILLKYKIKSKILIHVFWSINKHKTLISWMFCIWYSSTALHDVYYARMAETYLATANYVWPAAVDTLPLVKT